MNTRIHTLSLWTPRHWWFWFYTWKCSNDPHLFAFVFFQMLVQSLVMNVSSASRTHMQHGSIRNSEVPITRAEKQHCGRWISSYILYNSQNCYFLCLSCFCPFSKHFVLSNSKNRLISDIWILTKFNRETLWMIWTQKRIRCILLSEFSHLQYLGCR
jgi:hypothetical protein